ncbi:hypothetical protein TNCV_55101 [Trichonephila clavipes]|nr:hypothetical protein TNCV_55101 [Trichonephila clavipes]
MSSSLVLLKMMHVRPFGVSKPFRSHGVEVWRKAAREFLATDLVILNHGQMTRTTPELATSPPLSFIPPELLPNSPNSHSLPIDDFKLGRFDASQQLHTEVVDSSVTSTRTHDSTETVPALGFLLSAMATHLSRLLFSDDVSQI